jgi:hypothetical protein
MKIEIPIFAPERMKVESLLKRSNGKNRSGLFTLAPVV